jgi:hypothetical protein
MKVDLSIIVILLMDASQKTLISLPTHLHSDTITRPAKHAFISNMNLLPLDDVQNSDYRMSRKGWLLKLRQAKERRARPVAMT